MKTIADLKKEFEKQMLAKMEEYNRKPLSEDEKAAATKLAEVVAQTSNLKEMGII